MPGSRRPRAYLHVGLPKTGTSYLQGLVRANADELRDQGLVAVPEPARRAPALTSMQVTLALRDRFVEDRDQAAAAEVLDRFAAEVSAAGDADVLLSQEQLASCSRSQVRALVGHLGDREVHVLVTARALSRQVPSAWQERVKTRMTTSYADFVAAARDRTEPARGFWRNQDLPAVLARWGETLPPEQVHVITVPARRDGADQLEARYFGVLGVDHTRLRTTKARTNSSLGALQAELLRRVNVALGDRLASPRRSYSRVGKWYLAEQFLAPQGGAPPLLPESAEPWCRELTESWVAGIREAGYAVAGDLDDLRPDPSHFAPDLPAAGDAELLDSATRALADILAHRQAELDRIEGLTARVAELEAELARGAPAPRRRRGFWRRG